mmetsp:Transcript_14912/g.31554  ORF Transcript_14912/g.31554 Transcript_14912/m.31554 type:complete len:90 (+) Transcript_14912:130-399(+)
MMSLEIRKTFQVVLADVLLRLSMTRSIVLFKMKKRYHISSLCPLGSNLALQNIPNINLIPRVIPLALLKGITTRHSNLTPVVIERKTSN